MFGLIIKYKEVFKKNSIVKLTIVGLNLLLIAIVSVIPVHAIISQEVLDNAKGICDSATACYIEIVTNAANKPTDALKKEMAKCDRLKKECKKLLAMNKSSLSGVDKANDVYQQTSGQDTTSVALSNDDNEQESSEKYRNTSDISSIDASNNTEKILVWKQGESQDYQLYLTDINDRTPVSISPKYKHFSSYSPVTICSSKGSIAYTAGVSLSSDQSKLNIYFKELIGIEPLLLLKNATALGFSPDCNKLLYRKNTEHKLYLYSFVTKESELFFEGFPFNTAAWSPDGKHIVIESQKKGYKTELFLLFDLDNYPNVNSRNLTNTKNIKEKYPFFGGNKNIFYSEVKNRKIYLKSMNIYSSKIEDWSMKDVDVCMSTLGDSSIFLCHPVYTQNIKVIDKKARKEFVIKGMMAHWFPQNDTGDSEKSSTRIVGDQQLQQGDCEDSKEFNQLLEVAQVYVQSADYKKALESYEKAYHSCPTKDLEELIEELSEIND